jgi:hypothetical protein
MRPMHQLRVPKEAKQEDETERCDKCEEEFFPVHKLFLVGISVESQQASGLHRKTEFCCRCKNFDYEPVTKNDQAGMSNDKEARMLK